MKSDLVSCFPLPLRSRLARALAVPALTGLVVCGAGCSSDSDSPGTGQSQAGASATAGAGQSGGGVGGGGAPAAAGSANGGAGAGGTDAAGSAAGGSLNNGGAPGIAGGGTGGSAAGSAGSSGAAGATGGASSGCAGKAYKLCEDFEAGTVGAIPTSWTKLKGYGAGSAQDIALATDQFHSGKMAVKSSSIDTGQSRIRHSLSALGATASKHWGRIFYKVQIPAPKPAASNVFHVTFVGLDHGSDENRVVDVVEGSQGTHQWLFNNPNDNGGKGSAYDWTFDDAWHCAEWYVDVGAKSYRFFTDSKEVTSIGFTGKTDSQMANYTAVNVGAEFYQTPKIPFVIWFDDLAIDDAQIGCQ